MAALSFMRSYERKAQDLRSWAFRLPGVEVMVKLATEERASPDGVLMVVEVTSYDSGTHCRDREDKPRAYAEAGIPNYS